MANTLFSPYTLGALNLPNRMVMAPMTRNRNDENGVPQPMAATHYAQRATAGLLITEATQVSDKATGYMFTPGIYTEDQVRGWQAVTDAVHAKGGRPPCNLTGGTPSHRRPYGRRPWSSRPTGSNRLPHHAS